MTQPWLWAPARSGTPLFKLVEAGAVGNAPLPDDPPPSSTGVNWAPGALAGVLSHHTRPSSQHDAATGQVIAVIDAYRQGQLDRAALQRMYDLLAAGGADVSNRAARQVGEYARAQSDTARLQEIVPAVRDVASWLIDTGVNRAPVSTGLRLAALLNDCANRQDAVAVLGRHATFADAAIDALSRAGATEPIFALAQQHTGWGRIQAVEALVQNQRPDIRRWLLTEGFRNDVTWGYLALLVARNCGLVALLTQTRDLHRPGNTSEWTADDIAVLDGARDLLSTMLEPSGPSGDIADYPDAGAAVSLWLELTEARADGPAVRDLAFVVELATALTRDERLDDENGFEPGHLQSFKATCQRMLTSPQARQVIDAALDGGRPDELRWAARVAASLKIDAFPPFLPLLRQDPNDTGLWYNATQAVGLHVTDLVAAAQELLPADGVATDARACIGTAPGGPHMGVTFVLQQVVARAPGVGWPWLAGLLRSPLPGIRGQALSTLQAWPRGSWPAGATDVLRAARSAEDDPKLRERFATALG